MNADTTPLWLLGLMALAAIACLVIIAIWARHDPARFSNQDREVIEDHRELYNYPTSDEREDRF